MPVISDELIPSTMPQRLHLPLHPPTNRHRMLDSPRSMHTRERLPCKFFQSSISAVQAHGQKTPSRDPGPRTQDLNPADHSPSSPDRTRPLVYPRDSCATLLERVRRSSPSRALKRMRRDGMRWMGGGRRLVPRGRWCLYMVGFAPPPTGHGQIYASFPSHSHVGMMVLRVGEVARDLTVIMTRLYDRLN